MVNFFGNIAVHHSNDNLVELGNPGLLCGICNEEIPESDLSVTPCRHNFHRSCILAWLNEDDICPVCRRSFDSHSLKSFAEQENLDLYESQGARPKEGQQGPVTRSQTAPNNSFRGAHNFYRNRGRGSNSNRTPRSNNNNNKNENLNHINNVVQERFRNYEERFTRQMQEDVGRLVGESLDQYFQGLKVTETRNLIQVSERMNRSSDIPVNDVNQEQSSLHNPVRREVLSVVTPSIACKIISGWKLSYDGSLTSIPVDEFIYRVNDLTLTTLRGDYRSLCQNVHMLFEGKAKRWFWRYHHSVGDLDWFGICEDLRRNFKDFRTDFEIKESLRNLKQKAGESFENYLDHILTTADSLRHPLSEQELVEIVVRNLQPDIRLELLHLDLRSISDLRKACRRRENLFAEMQMKAPVQRSNVQGLGCKNISEIDD